MSTDKKPKRAAIYVRQLPGGLRAGRVTSAEYAIKFAELIRAALSAGSGEDAPEILVVDHPGVLGDTYAELLQSLSLLAEAGLHLAIAGPQPNTYRLDRLRRTNGPTSTQAPPSTARRLPK